MKTRFLLSTCLIALTAHAQVDNIETHNVKFGVTTTEGDCYNVIADRSSFNHTERIIEYTNIKSLTTDIIEVCDAEKVVYDFSTNEFILTGSFSFTGVPLHIDLPYKGQVRQLRYKIGDTVAYIE